MLLRNLCNTEYMMPYNGSVVRIVHAPTKELEAYFERYFFYPLPQWNLQHIDTFHNEATDQSEVHFQVDLWNQHLKDAALHYMSSKVNHPLMDYQMNVMDFDKVWPTSKETSVGYRFPKDGLNYAGQKFYFIPLLTKTMEDANQIASHMKATPADYAHLKLKFCKKTKCEVLPIKMNNWTVTMWIVSLTNHCYTTRTAPPDKWLRLLLLSY